MPALGEGFAVDLKLLNGSLLLGIRLGFKARAASTRIPGKLIDIAVCMRGPDVPLRKLSNGRVRFGASAH